MKFVAAIAFLATSAHSFAPNVGNPCRKNERVLTVKKDGEDVMTSSKVNVAPSMPLASSEQEVPKEGTQGVESESSSWDASQWHPSMAAFRTEDRFMSPSMLYPRGQVPPRAEHVFSSTPQYSSALPSVDIPLDSVDRHFTPGMLNPMGRPLRGIYSDEGVGYERGGADLTTFRFGEHDQPVLQYIMTSDALPFASKSFIATSNKFSMEAQRQELSEKLNEPTSTTAAIASQSTAVNTAVNKTNSSSPKSNTIDTTGNEKLRWEEAATKHGIILKSVDLRDSEGMKELYELLGVKGVAEKSRLRSYMESLANPTT